MTDLTLPTSAIRRPRPIRRIAMVWTAVATAALFGAVMGLRQPADPSAAEIALVVLLRFMAVAKAATACLAALLVSWRVGRELRQGAFAAYLAALAAMAAAPGLVWGLEMVAQGALVFHAGLVAFLLIAARDETLGTSLSRVRRRAS